MNILLLALVAGMIVGTGWPLLSACVRRKEVAPGRAELAGLAASMAAVLLVAGIVLLGESLFDLRRCAIRAWIASSILAALCLVLGASWVSRGSLWSLATGLALLIGACLVFMLFPSREHAFRGEVFSRSSLVVMATAAVPAVSGAFKIRAYLRRLAVHRPGRARPRMGRLLRMGTWCLATVAVAIVVLACFLPFDAKTRIAANHKPVIPWWVPGAAAAAFVAAAAGRWRLGGRLATNAGIIISGAALTITVVLVAAEQVIARSPYLSYHFGSPQLVMPLGWLKTCLLLGLFCLGWAGMLGLTRAIRGRRPVGNRWVLLCVTATATAASFFLSANYVTATLGFVRGIVCIDRADGRIRWVCEGIREPRGALHKENSAATPTPVTDGRSVYAYFGSPGLMSCDLGGRLQWVCTELPFETVYGAACSPVLCGDKVVVASDSAAGNYIAAVDCHTGKVVWKTARPAKTTPSGVNRTPLVASPEGRALIIVSGVEDTTAYDPATGREVWTHAVPHVGGDCVGSAVHDGQRLYLAGSWRVLAMKLAGPGRGDGAVAWSAKLAGPNCSSPVLAEGLLFAVTDTGKAMGVDSLTGEELWREDLPGKHYTSVFACDKRVYFCNTQGRTTIVAAERSFRKLAENDLGEMVFASFAASDGALFIRTIRHLFCLREQGR